MHSTFVLNTKFQRGFCQGRHNSWIRITFAFGEFNVVQGLVLKILMISDLKQQ